MHTGLPVITGMGLSVSEAPYTVTCNSTGSPATKVIWTFNGKQISSGGIYTTEQKIIDRRASSYMSVLIVNSSFEDTVGEYSCRVENKFGITQTMKREIKGLLSSIIVVKIVTVGQENFAVRNFSRCTIQCIT